MSGLSGDSTIMRRVAELGYRRSAFRARSRAAISELSKIRDNMNSCIELLSSGKKKEAKDSAKELITQSVEYLNKLIAEFEKD